MIIKFNPETKVENKLIENRIKIIYSNSKENKINFMTQIDGLEALINRVTYENQTKENSIIKLIYKIKQSRNSTRIFGKEFVFTNRKKVKIIINNRRKKLEEQLSYNNTIESIKIKAKIYDNIIFLSSMFNKCETLKSISNLSKLKTNHAKDIIHYS